jgi:hypothetical protein
MATCNTRDPEFLRWLANLTQERELVVRMAMRQVFDNCRDDRAWSARIDELLREINPGDWKLALIRREVDRVAEMLEEVEAATIVDGTFFPADTH